MLLPLGAGRWGGCLLITRSCLILCFARAEKRFANAAAKLLNCTVVFCVCLFVVCFFNDSVFIQDWEGKMGSSDWKIYSEYKPLGFGAFSKVRFLPCVER